MENALFKHPDCWKVGDFVYHNSNNDIGQLTQVPCPIYPNHNFRIEYCQGKRLSPSELIGFVSGGNGPVFAPGYPKKVTEIADVLFVKAAKVQYLRNAAQRLIEKCQKDIDAMMHTRKLLIDSEPNKT